MRNGLWSLMGQAEPVVVALATIPALIHGLGVERFGVLTMVWMLVGYFSLFDLGLGWALTRVTSEHLAAGRLHAPQGVVLAAFAAMTALGAVGATVIVATSTPLASLVLRVSPALQAETARALVIIAIALPAVTGTTALTGLLAAHQRFDLINAVRLPLGLLNYLGPLATLPFTRDLGAVASVLVAQRLLAALAYVLIVMRTLPGLGSPRRPDWRALRPLLQFGRWMVITNTVGPVMVYMDRYLVAAIVSAATVAYYTTPFDLISRLWLLTSPLTSVLFPAFAAAHAVDRVRAQVLFERGAMLGLALLLPGALLCSALAPEGIRLWLGEEFAARSAVVLQVLAMGILVNGVAQVALALIQAAGRPDLGARLHLVEMPLYLVLVVLLTQRYGLVGAAVAWTARATVDAAVLLFWAARLVSLPMRARLRGSVWLLAAVLAVGVPLGLESPLLRAAWAAALLGVAGWLAVRRAWLGTVWGWLRASSRVEAP